MPLGGLLPYPNQMPMNQPPMPPMGGPMGGPVPPPGMAPPPQVDSMKLVMAFLNQLQPEEQRGAVYGIGMSELLKKMDLKRRQREGADGVPGQQASPMMGALRASSPPGPQAAPLAPPSPQQGGF